MPHEVQIRTSCYSGACYYNILENSKQCEGRFYCESKELLFSMIITAKKDTAASLLSKADGRKAGRTQKREIAKVKYGFNNLLKPWGIKFYTEAEWYKLKQN